GGVDPAGRVDRVEGDREPGGDPLVLPPVLDVAQLAPHVVDEPGDQVERLAGELAVRVAVEGAGEGHLAERAARGRQLDADLEPALLAGELAPQPALAAAAGGHPHDQEGRLDLL